MERREQVFVSSTYTDLRMERQAVIQGLLEADCIPAGMELFPASDSDKWSLIQGVIDDSDYYLLIIGGRYGSVDPASELSYTEMEFDYAASVGKPIMAFLHGQPGSIPFDKSELDSPTREKLAVFRSKAEQRMVKYWTTPHDLDGAVAKSLIKIRKSHPVEGWVRARYAMTPEVERDIAELHAKVSELTHQLESRGQAQLKVPERLARGDDQYEFFSTLTYWPEGDREKPRHQRRMQRKSIKIPATWNEILAHLGPSLLDETDEDEIASELRTLAMTILANDDDLLPDDFGGDSGFELYSESTKDIIVQLFALGLISHGTKRRPISDTGKYWKLTDSGLDNLMVLRAIKRIDPA